MPQINFSNLDFDQIKISIKDYLRANSDFTDFDYEGSNLSAIIDILAYNTYLNSFNANMIANEVFIDSATLRENVVSLARNIGYVPRSKTSSKAFVSFIVDTSGASIQPLTLTLKAGVCAVSNVFGSESYTFSIPEDITVPVVNRIASFNDIQIYEGFLITQTFTYNSALYNQRFILNNNGIDTSTLRVKIRNSATDATTYTYNLVDNISNVNSTSNIFLIQEIEDQRYEVLFGDGTFGKNLQNGNIISATYIVTNGKLANGVSSFSFSGKIVDNNQQTVNIGISNLATTISSSGGDDIESTSSVRNYAPRTYSTQNRAVTSSDYEALVHKIFPEAESVSAFGGEDLSPPQYGKVFITIKPKNYNYISDYTKRSIIKDLKKYSVAGIIPQITDIKYLFVEITSSVYYNSNLTNSVDTLRTNITNSLNTYAKSADVNNFGSRLKYSKLLKAIDDVDSAITSNITLVKMRRDLRVVLNTFADYEICFGNSFHLKYDVSGNKTPFNIKSSAFQLDGISGDLYLSDYPDPSNNQKGTIFVFKKLSDTEYQIVKRSTGTIDYSKGEIILSLLNIVSTEISNPTNIIQIEAVPESNDVIGLQDLYLQIDMNNTSITMIPDTISSGTDTSGYSYSRTSSFSNGSITR
jgi:hypothetical protein